MIIDSHAHIVMPPESFRYMAELVGGRANPSTTPKIPDASVRKMAEELVHSMDSVGTDVQFISPRPYLQMHSVKPGRVSELWSRHCNDLIARFVEMFPDRFRGVAGLPQYMDEPLEVRAIPELRRCVERARLRRLPDQPRSDRGRWADAARAGRSVLAPAVPGDDRARRARPDPLGRQLQRARVVHAEVHQRGKHRHRLAARRQDLRRVPDAEDRRRPRRRRDSLPDGTLSLVERAQGRDRELRRAAEEAVLRHLQLLARKRSSCC